MPMGIGQKASAKEFGVDERELRDYVAFWTGQFPEISKNQQDCLNDAYDLYCFDNAAKKFTYYLERVAGWRGLKPRAMREIWEVNPNAYPANYKK